MGRIVTLTGRSGSGKTTIARELLTNVSGATMVMSHTTRHARESDLPGEYRYLDGDTGNILRQPQWHPAYLWVVGRNDTHYGTPKVCIDTVLRTEGAVGLMLVVPDVLQLLRTYVIEKADRRSISHYYLKAPLDKELIRRMKDRGEKDETIVERLSLDHSWDQEIVDLNIPIYLIPPMSIKNTVVDICTSLR